MLAFFFASWRRIVRLWRISLEECPHCGQQLEPHTEREQMTRCPDLHYGVEIVSDECTVVWNAEGRVIKRLGTGKLPKLVRPE